jgi:putative cell wall-binding protein
MRRLMSSALLTAASVPALLVVPVIGRVAVPAYHPVAASVRAVPLSGVDAAALAELRAAAASGSASGSGAGTAAGRVAVRTAPAPAVLTAPMATKAYDLIAVSWQHGSAPSGTTVSVRVRERNVWTAWTPLSVDEDGPDPASPDAARAAAVGAPDATAPLLTGRADGVQVRVDTATGTAPRGLRVDLVDGGTSAADAASAGAPLQAASAATSQPRIVTRGEWGADETLAKPSPVLGSGSVRALILHHTDTANSYSPEQAYAQVRSLFAFHTTVRGWNDVGYNFLVDRYGTVYEGRRGSIGAAVMGAQAGGFNAQTLGIAVLGTFSSVALPDAVRTALVPLLAWKAAELGINPAGRTSLVSSGGSYTRYKAGTAVGVYGVSGHRDVDSTECPGNSAYPVLGGLRSQAAALMVPDLVGPTLSAGRVGVAGDPVAFSAVVPTRQRFTLTVSRLCGGTPVRVLTGASSSRIGKVWDLRDTDGTAVPPGLYTVTVTSSSPVGSAPTFRQDVEVVATPASVAAAGRTSGGQVAAGTLGAPEVGSGPRLPLQVISTDAAPTSAPTSAPTGSPTSSSTAPTSTTSTTRTTTTTSRTTTSSTTTTATSSTPPGGGLPTALVSGCPVQRVAATDPALTSVLAGRLARPDARTVVLANAAVGEPLGQALTAAPLAAAQQAPLLLTAAGGLPDVVAQEISARGVTTAWLVGSTAVISAAVEQQLRVLGVTTIHRVAGTDRWSTAAAVASEVGAPTGEALLASGDPGELLDTLVAAGSAAAVGRPVLLTSRTGVPAATLAALGSLHIRSVTVIGSTAAVPEPTLTALAGAGVTRRTRVVGAGRWATAAAIADAVAGTAATDRVVLASGREAAADLLVATGQARPIVLTSDTVLPWETAAWLRRHPAPAVWLVARPDAVTPVVLHAVQSTR